MDKKILVFIGIFFVFIIFILFLIASNKPKVKNESNQTQTIVSPIQKIQIKDFEKPTNPPIISPAEFTGVKEEELPPKIKDYSDQKLDLLKKLPLKMSYFIIDFDYVEDKFTVSYLEPKSSSKNLFSSWLFQNYPALKISDFIEK
ncbi:MAG: hypothetical protein NZM02_01420 [Patescibacteria group bacterium]|nr:hypothetical protein [Patescibacteria group bacterium]